MKKRLKIWRRLRRAKISGNFRQIRVQIKSTNRKKNLTKVHSLCLQNEFVCTSTLTMCKTKL